MAGFFLAQAGQALVLMSACCAIASGGDDGRFCLWPSLRPGLPVTMKGAASASATLNSLVYV